MQPLENKEETPGETTVSQTPAAKERSSVWTNVVAAWRRHARVIGLVVLAAVGTITLALILGSSVADALFFAPASAVLGVGSFRIITFWAWAFIGWLALLGLRRRAATPSQRGPE